MSSTNSSANPFLDGVAKAMGEAAGIADGVRKEAETVFQSGLQRYLSDMDLVPREEFEAVKEMAVQALEEVAALRAELDALRSGQDSGAGEPNG